MRKTRLAGMLAVTGALAGLLALLATPSPVTASVVTVAATATPSQNLTRDWCIKSGTGELRNLWLTGPRGTCPAPYWGPVKLGDGAAGPAGPAGPPGAAGDNSVVIKTATTVFDATHSGVRTVTVSGMPAYVAGAPEVNGHFSTTLPDGVTVNVAKVNPVAGHTTRDFTVEIAGGPLKAPDTVTVTVWALAVVLPS